MAHAAIRAPRAATPLSSGIASSRAVQSTLVGAVSMRMLMRTPSPQPEERGRDGVGGVHGVCGHTSTLHAI
ncbi:hypothetical protein GCM10025863_27770 [Microbacterium suwonense]|uniref:Uncharacterized protein n=1 Tax=Microbacterium suwonense TaxID=683047 RepID=A0ABM8FWU6_9MICO|nr:hypothetical protein GCM10025863_27770 [Microbacterium suwonense]